MAETIYDVTEMSVGDVDFLVENGDIDAEEVERQELERTDGDRRITIFTDVLDYSREDAEELIAAAKEQERNQALERFGTNKVLIRYTGTARSRHVLGYKWTREHPFAVVDADDAAELLDNRREEFRQATKDEAKEYYG